MGKRIGTGARRSRGRAVLVATGLVAVSAVVAFAWRGDGDILGFLAVLPAVFVATFADDRRTGRCRWPWARRHER